MMPPVSKLYDVLVPPVLKALKPRPALPGCALGMVGVIRGCGHRQGVVLGCGKPTCPDCERRRAAKALHRWQPVIDGMRHPKMIVLAVVSNVVLAVAAKNLAKCFTRFMDLRIGGRQRPYFKQKTIDFVEAHKAEFDANHEKDPASKDAAAWLVSCARFWDNDLAMLARVLKAKRRRRALDPSTGMKVRDLFYGLRSLDITWNPMTGGWHPHLHLLVDSVYIPFPALLMLWVEACTINDCSMAAFGDPDDVLEPGQSIGQTAHVSALRKPQEVLKYVTKNFDGSANALPHAQKDELVAFLYRKKRVWPVGKAKPRKLDTTCPKCKDPNCKCGSRVSFTQKTLDADVWGTADGRHARFYRVKGLGLTWDEVTMSLAGGWISTAFSSHDGGSATEGEANAPPAGP